MSIEKVFRNQFMQISSPEKLKQGQIIVGQIKKIFKNNNAQIKIGNRLMIAQIEAPLVVGELYYFQVESSSDHIHLKVIAEKPQNFIYENIHSLLEHLEIPNNKTSINFMRFITEHKIPFDKIQLKKAIEILNGTRNKTIAQNVIGYMFLRDMPMSEQVFEALYMIQTKQFSEQLHSVLNQLQQQNEVTFIEHQLMDKIRLLLGQPMNQQNIVISQIMNEVVDNNDQLFNLLNSLRLTDQVTFFNWKSEWELFVNQSLLSANQSVNELPFNMNIQLLLQLFSHIDNHQNELFQVSQMLLEKHAYQLSEISTYPSSISHEQYSLLKNDLTEFFIPLLPKTFAEDFIRSVENNRDALDYISSILHTLSNKQTYQTIKEIILQTNQDKTSIKETFLTHLSRVIHLTGLTDEYMIANENVDRTIQSIKSMLIQVIQQNNFRSDDQAQLLLNLINGLQLQSVHEANGFLYTVLQIPGEKLNLNNDIQLEFSSQKNKDGSINPDYCRILFYLDLNNLNETVIDMQIQNRFVSIIIYNDEEKFKNQFALFQPSLKKALKNHDYHLTSVKVKLLKQKKAENHSNSVKSNQISLEGIDFRV